MDLNRLLTFLCYLAAISLPERTLYGQDSSGLRQELEAAYARWRSAVLAKDARSWAAAITMHRQVITRNLVISQGLPFPKSVFETMLSPADISGLRLLEAQAVGDTAHLLFFGKVDMGDAPDLIPENLLLLKFFREKQVWKFDSSKFIQLSSQPERRIKLLAGEPPDFLDLPEFTPPGTPPAPPPLCAVPDHITGCTLQTIGYETTLIVNGQEHYAADTIAKFFLTGGLKNGSNMVQLRAKKLALPKEAKDADRVLEIDFFTKPSQPSVRPARVFHYEYRGKGGPKDADWTLEMPAARELSIIQE